MESRERDEILRYLRDVRKGKYVVMPNSLTGCSVASLEKLAKNPEKSMMPDQVSRYVGRAYLTKYLTGKTVSTVHPTILILPFAAGMLIPAVAPIAVASALIIGTAGVLLKGKRS